MTRESCKDLVGRKTNIMNSSGTIVDGLVSEDDLNDFISVRYNEMYTFIAEKYPENFEVTTQFDLVEDRQLYAFADESSDYYAVRWVGLMYTSTDTYYTVARQSSYNQLHKYTSDTSFFSAANPKFAQTTLKEEGTGLLYPAVYIVPAPSDDITDGLQIRYLEIPAISADGDEFLGMPETAQHLISYAVISDVWEKKGDWAKAERAFNRFLLARQEFIEGYKPRATDSPARMVPEKIFNPYRRIWQE